MSKIQVWISIKMLEISWITQHITTKITNWDRHNKNVHFKNTCVPFFCENILQNKKKNFQLQVFIFIQKFPLISLFLFKKAHKKYLPLISSFSLSSSIFASLTLFLSVSLSLSYLLFLSLSLSFLFIPSLFPFFSLSFIFFSISF